MTLQGMVNIITRHNRPLYIFAGISPGRNTDRRSYQKRGERPYLDTNKAALPFGVSTILEQAVENYRAARHEGNGIGPITVWGPQEVKEYLDEKKLPVSYANVGHTLAEKLRTLGKLGSKQVHLATVDIVPSVPDLEKVVATADMFVQKDYIAMPVHAAPLVKSGFRKNLHHKLYRLKVGDKVHSVSFPQLWTFRPDSVRFSWLAGHADTIYRNRGDGVRGMGWLQLMKDLRKDEDGNLDLRMLAALPKAAIRITGVCPRQYGLPNFVPTTTDANLQEVIALTLYSRNPDHVGVRILDAPTIAMDIDWPSERQIREEL